MAISLYTAVIPSFQQILGSVSGLLGKAQAFCAERNIAPEEIIQARLAADMLPFAYQVTSTVAHSIGAIRGVRNGVFTPDMTPPPESFAALEQQIAEARGALDSIDPEEIEGFIGQDMRFEIGARRMDFTAEDFLLSFSLPNFHFHAATAYDILRMKGVAIGKRDFLGHMRLKA